jgi:Tol biopolymer transport system component
VLVGGIARAGLPPAVVPRDTEPWWIPHGTAVAFQRDAPGLESGDVLFTPTVRGREVDIIGAGRMRGFRPGGSDLLVENGSSTSVLDSTDRRLGSVPGTDATWSPDGMQIAFLQGDALEASAASGADVRQLADGIVPPTSDLSGPMWSPDGKAIAIATKSAAGSAIEIVPADGSEAHIAFDGGGDNVDPSWSPDGSALAFEPTRAAAGRSGSSRRTARLPTKRSAGARTTASRSGARPTAASRSSATAAACGVSMSALRRARSRS